MVETENLHAFLCIDTLVIIDKSTTFGHFFGPLGLCCQIKFKSLLHSYMAYAIIPKELKSQTQTFGWSSNQIPEIRNGPFSEPWIKIKISKLL